MILQRNGVPFNGVVWIGSHHSPTITTPNGQVPFAGRSLRWWWFLSQRKWFSYNVRTTPYLNPLIQTHYVICVIHRSFIRSVVCPYLFVRRLSRSSVPPPHQFPLNSLSPWLPAASVSIKWNRILFILFSLQGDKIRRREYIHHSASP